MLLQDISSDQTDVSVPSDCPFPGKAPVQPPDRLQRGHFGFPKRFMDWARLRTPDLCGVPPRKPRCCLAPDQHERGSDANVPSRQFLRSLHYTIWDYAKRSEASLLRFFSRYALSFQLSIRHYVQSLRDVYDVFALKGLSHFFCLFQADPQFFSYALLGYYRLLSY